MQKLFCWIADLGLKRNREKIFKKRGFLLAWNANYAIIFWLVGRERQTNYFLLVQIIWWFLFHFRWSRPQGLWRVFTQIMKWTQTMSRLVHKYISLNSLFDVGEWSTMDDFNKFTQVLINTQIPSSCLKHLVLHVHVEISIRTTL